MSVMEQAMQSQMEGANYLYERMCDELEKYKLAYGALKDANVFYSNPLDHWTEESRGDIEMNEMAEFLLSVARADKEKSEEIATLRAENKDLDQRIFNAQLSVKAFAMTVDQQDKEIFKLRELANEAELIIEETYPGVPPVMQYNWLKKKKELLGC